MEHGSGTIGKGLKMPPPPLLKQQEVVVAVHHLDLVQVAM